jgi:hypothetical protein
LAKSRSWGTWGNCRGQGCHMPLHRVQQAWDAVKRPFEPEPEDLERRAAEIRADRFKREEERLANAAQRDRDRPAGSTTYPSHQ